MTRKIAGTCIAAMFGFAVAAAAQTPPTQPPTDPQQPTMAQPATPDRPSMGKEKKLTGCVQSGTEAGTFELTNIKGKEKDTASAGATGAAGTAGASASGAMSSKAVKLMASPDVDLASHVGHTVELTGMWSAGAGSSSSSTSTSPSESTGGSMAHKGGAFQVSKVKMVSSTCSTGTN